MSDKLDEAKTILTQYENGCISEYEMWAKLLVLSAEGVEATKGEILTTDGDVALGMVDALLVNQD